MRANYECRRVWGCERDLVTNLVVIKDSVIIGFKKKYKLIYELLMSWGLRVVLVPMLMNDGGGIRCMTQWRSIGKDCEIY